MQNELALGSFCAVRDRGVIYLYGYKCGADFRIALGRVPVLEAHERTKYQYWTVLAGAQRVLRILVKTSSKV
jgi:hypothetical protein